MHSVYKNLVIFPKVGAFDQNFPKIQMPGGLPRMGAGGGDVEASL